MAGPVAEAAARPPVPPAELKAFLRLAASDEDALLAALVRSAADACEAFVGRLLIARGVAEALPASTGWTRLGLAPVRAIESVAALGADGAETALPAAAFAIDIDAAGEGWVRLTAPRDERRVQVRYTAGLAEEANGVPEAIRHGIVRLAAHLYARRDTAEPAPPPAAVSALWRPWRRLRLS